MARLKSPAILAVSLALAIAAAAAAQTSPSRDTQRQTAVALEQQGRNAEAEAAWRAVAKAHPSDAEAYAHLGLLQARQEHYQQAIPLYRKALELSPAFPALRLNLGLALFKAGQMKDAAQQFAILLKNEPPNSPQAQRLDVLLGMSHYALHDYAGAVPYLKKAAALDPQSLKLRLSLAHSCLWSKQYQCVLDTYREILVLDPNSAEADMLAGEALDEMLDSPGAIRQFRAAVKADPSTPDVHFGLGYLLWKAKQYNEAIPEFQAELNNNPHHIDAMAHLADAELQLQHPDIASPLLQKVIAADPNFALARLDLGIVYADEGRNDEALQQLTLAARLTPEDVNVHWRLARLYRAMGKKDEAKAEFAKASSITRAADNALVEKMHSGHSEPAASTPDAAPKAVAP